MKFYKVLLCMVVCTLLSAHGLLAGPLTPLSQVGDQPVVSTADLAWSPDARHAYVVTNSALALMERRSDGLLRTLVLYRGGERGIAPFRFPQRVTVSPDGRHVYLATHDAILAFERRLENGRLQFIADYVNQRAGVQGLAGIRRLQVTPDGLQLLVASTEDQGYLEVFRRDPASGSLDFVRDSVVGQTGSAGATAMVQTADGRHVYVTTAPENTLTHLTRRPAAARLEVVRTYGSSSDFEGRMASPLALVLSPEEDFLYVLAQSSQAIVVLARDTTSGALRFVEAAPGTGQLPLPVFAIALEMSTDGRHLYVAQSPNDAVAQFERSADGRLSFLGNYPGSATGLDQTQALIAGPQGDRLYHLSFQGAGAVMDRDGTSGLLSYSGPLLPLEGDMVDGLERPESMVLSADGRHLYVAGSGDDAIVALRLEAGRLDPQTIDIERQGEDGAGALRRVAALALSPDGRHLYATGRDGNIDGFERDDASGALQWSHSWPGEIDGIDLSLNTDLLIDRAGAHLYVTSSSNSALVVLQRDADDGHLETLQSLTRRDGVEGVRFPQALASSPDERFVYVANASNNIGMFERSLDTGLLTPRGEVPLSAASALVVSDDGRFLYGAHAGLRHQLTIYRRDLGDGSLTLLRSIEAEGAEGLPLAEATDLAFDPPEARLYVTGFGDNALLTFERDELLGDLTYLGAEFNSVFNVSGLAAPSGVVVADDGTVVVSSLGDQQVTTFTPGCAESHLCLMALRYRVEVAYRDFAGNEGMATALPTPSDDSAVLWFFQADNWEMLVKLVDGCEFNDHTWVFASAATNIETVLRVTDTWSGITAEYTNPLGQSPRAVTDVQALATCSAIRP